MDAATRDELAALASASPQALLARPVPSSVLARMARTRRSSNGAAWRAPRWRPRWTSRRAATSQARARTSGSDIYINVMFRAFFPLPTPPVPPISSTGGVLSPVAIEIRSGRCGRSIASRAPARARPCGRSNRPARATHRSRRPDRPVPRTGIRTDPEDPRPHPVPPGEPEVTADGAGPHPRAGRHAGHAARRVPGRGSAGGVSRRAHPAGAVPGRVARTRVLRRPRRLQPPRRRVVHGAGHEAARVAARHRAAGRRHRRVGLPAGRAAHRRQRSAPASRVHPHAVARSGRRRGGDAQRRAARDECQQPATPTSTSRRAASGWRGGSWTASATDARSANCSASASSAR